MKELDNGIILLFVAIPVFANDLSDMDSDGVPDIDEINIYRK